MNATVARIVDILFQDAEMNEENQALHDELMRNCQDRYDDLIAQGHTEDDAIAVVIDSLKGMEEVIGGRAKRPAENSTAPEGNRFVSFAAEGIRQIRADLREQDVRVVPGEGREIVVRWDPDELPGLNAHQEGDQVIIRLDSTQRTSRAEGGWKWLADLFSSIHMSGTVLVEVPADSGLDVELHTLSGDLDVRNVSVQSLTLNTTSGDVKAEISAPMLRMNAQTASGDLHANMVAQEGLLRSMSGDVTCLGCCDRLDASSVSGDMNLRGRFVAVQVKSVSGDVRLDVEDDRLRSVTANSTSGDVDLRLPTTLPSIHVSFTSVSGDAHNRFPDAGPSAQVQITAHTVSGDVTVR